MRHTLSGRARRSMLKLVVDQASQKVVGAHMLGEDAPEIMQGLAIAHRDGRHQGGFRSHHRHPSDGGGGVRHAAHAHARGRSGEGGGVAAKTQAGSNQAAQSSVFRPRHTENSRTIGRDQHGPATARLRRDKHVVWTNGRPCAFECCPEVPCFLGVVRLEIQDRERAGQEIRDAMRGALPVGTLRSAITELKQHNDGNCHGLPALHSSSKPCAH